MLNIRVLTQSLVLLCAAIFVLTGHAAPAEAQAKAVAPTEYVYYRVKRGDNLYTLAQRYFHRTSQYRVVQRVNRIANPRQLTIGTNLRIPLSILKAKQLTARILAMRGTVNIQDGGRGITPEIGTRLGRGARIETGIDGFITLGLPNGSRTSLPTRSRMSILQLRKFILTDSIDYDFAVEAGKVEAKASPMDKAKGLFRIRTKRSVAAVRGTQFRVGDADEAALTEVLEGTVAAGADSENAQAFEQGFGAVISDAGVRRETLLVAPELQSPGKVQVEPYVQLSYAPVSGAKGYHLLVATDAGFADIIAEALTEGPDFSLPNIPNGNLFVRASAIAQSGLEGLTETYSMRRVLTGLAGSAEADDNGMTFRWSGDGEGRRLYRFQLVRDKNAGVPVVDEPGLESDAITLSNLSPGIYYWRVGVRQFSEAGVSENWLPFEKVTIAAPEL